MSKQRYWIATAVIWLMVFFFIPVTSNNIMLHAWLFPLLGAMTLAELLSNTKSKYRFGISLVVSYLLILVTTSGSAIEYLSLSTVYEISGLFLTWGIIRKIKLHTLEFEDALEQIIVINHGCIYESDENVKKQMDREIRRARRFERPLSLVSIKPEYDTEEMKIHQVLKSISHDLANKYKKGRLAQFLSEYSKSSDIVTYQDDEFLVMLPETTRGESEVMLERISDLCKESLEISVETGIASFPDEEITFAGLVERSQLARSTTKQS